MATTFNPNLATPKDRIRQRIGDVDFSRAPAQVQDETIAAYLSQGFTELRCAARLCRDIAARYANVGDLMIDGQRSSTGKIYDHYISLAAQIEAEERPATQAQVDSGQGAVLVGGIGDCRGPIDCDPWSRWP